MNEVLIVGANGFLGHTLANKCLELGWTTDAVVNKSMGNLPAGIRHISQADRLEELIGNNYKYIFNVAAFIPYGAYNTPNENLIEANVNLPLRLHKAFPGAKVIYASSISVYGNNTSVINEKSDCISPTLYGLSKWSGELITQHHSSYSVIRFSSLYGRGMFQGTFIPRVINDAKTKKLITLLGTGERKQNYLHIKDAANYCIHAALNGNNETYLGVSTKAYANKEVAETVAKLVGNCEVTYTGTDNSPHFLYENQHTLDNLKFSPVITLEEGIKELINE